jgi:hypothetical protein
MPVRAVGAWGLQVGSAIREGLVSGVWCLKAKGLINKDEEQTISTCAGNIVGVPGSWLPGRQ